MRIPAVAQREARRQRIAKAMTFDAPRAGWISNESLTDPVKGGAEVLTNFFPTATGARLRCGSVKHATIGDGSQAVTAFMTYSAGGTEKVFAATGTDIYDVSTPADPDVSPTADVSTQTSGDWVAVQFVNSAGTWLRAVNGSNTPQLFNGTSWTTTPAITGATPTTLSYVWAHKNRLWFIQKNTLDAWYLPVDNIGGAATKFPMQGVFSRGGSLLFGTTWSIDDNSGLAAHCAFVTTEGEIAIYDGSDPGSSSTWQLRGVYRMGRPLGKKAWIRAGGDVVIATDVGFVPISQAITRDYAALAPVAVSYPIETEWNRLVERRSGTEWHCEVWPTQQMAVVAPPAVSGDSSSKMLVANVRTGAWALYTGWPATCVAVIGSRLFFGTADGKIIQAETTGTDQGAPYSATYIPLFADAKTPASKKVAGLCRVAYRSPEKMSVKLSAQFDYVTSIPAAPSALFNAASGSSIWGTALWGTGVWGGQRVKQHFIQTESTPGDGYALSCAVQMTCGQPATPEVELVRVDMTYDTGDIFT